LFEGERDRVGERLEAGELEPGEFHWGSGLV
jgi:hypothetical protein